MLVKEESASGKEIYLKENVIEPREYQASIANKCVNKNSLVVIPTGLGKTVISVLIAAKTLERFPPESKIVVLAPTRPLINQHYNSFMTFLTIPEDKFTVLTGKILPEERTKLFLTKQVVFFTPQTLRNDLVKKRYDLEDTCLIVFDEAHHATGDYPYTMIADKYVDQNPDGNILALTASPGSSKQKIQELCDTLHIALKNTHFRTRKDSDVKEYLKPLDLYKVGVDLTDLMKDTFSVLKTVVEERLQYLSQLSFLDKKSDCLFNKIIRKDILKLNKELVKIINGDGDKEGAYAALSITAQALILYHMIELVEQQGLDNVLMYFEQKIYKEALKPRCSKAVRILASDYRLRRVYLELKQHKEYSSHELVHPKFQILEKLILKELSHNPDSRMLVFVKLRVSVINIEKRLNRNGLIKAIKFVGQTTKSKEDKGLSQKRQIEILEEFREGKYNVLVSTNVGEEGLDIAECDMVVFYDVVASEIRFIQRRGRTARHREGKVVILYARETNDDIYMKIVLNKLKKMNINLKSPIALNEYYNITKEKTDLEDISRDRAPIVSESRNIRASKSKTTNKKTHNIVKQSNLQSFMGSNHSTVKVKKPVPRADVELSNLLPMKLGLRKRLSNDNIPFQTTTSKYHVLIYNKVLIQVYNAQDSSDEMIDTLLIFNNKQKAKFELLIIIFSFIDFKDSFEDEARLVKKKLKQFGVDNKLQIITIDNPEELYFIVKSIVEQKKE